MLLLIYVTKKKEKYAEDKKIHREINTVFTLRECFINEKNEIFDFPTSLFFLSAPIFFILQFLAIQAEMANQEESLLNIFFN